MNQQLPTIKSVGPPPEKYADRIVAEMLRLIVRARATRFSRMKQIMRETPDGNPGAQAKLAKRIADSGKPFILHVELLEPGKRGRYKLGVFLIDGWDAAKKHVIFEKDPIPEKPWLACSHIKLISHGRGRYSEEDAISLAVTHHALSRLVQRCGGVTAGDLLTAVKNIWWTFLEENYQRRDAPPWARNGFRLRFPLDRTRWAYAVLERYADDEGGVVVATILDSI